MIDLMYKAPILLAGFLASQCAVNDPGPDSPTLDNPERRTMTKAPISGQHNSSHWGHLLSESDVQTQKNSPLKGFVVFQFSIESWDVVASANDLHLRAAGAGRATVSDLVDQGGQYDVSDASGYFKIDGKLAGKSVICVGEELRLRERTVEFVGCKIVEPVSPVEITIGIGGLGIKGAG